MKKRTEIVILTLYPIVAATASFLFNVNVLTSIALFFGIPAFYLTFRVSKYIIKKALFFSSLGIPFIIFIDYIAEINRTWVIPYSVIPQRLFGFVTLEVIVWIFLHIYFIILFYEHFLDKHTTQNLKHPRMKHLVLLLLIIFSIFLVFLFGHPQLLHIPYWYLTLGLIFLLPPIIFQQIRFPMVFLKMLRVAAYFFYLTFIYEITALKLGWWLFPGREYIGLVLFFGVQFPFEEFVFWLMLATLSCLSYYEFYYDDEK